MSDKERIDVANDELTDEELERAAGGGNAPGAFDNAGSRGKAAKRGSSKRASKSGGMRHQAGDATGGNIE